MIRIPDEGFRAHPIADAFPLMCEEEVQALADDIRVNGLLQKIELYKNQILDGRNRYRALKLLGTEKAPHYFTDLTERFQGMEKRMVLHVLSRNLHRRHLTDGQKAEIGLRIKRVQVEFAKERKKAGKKIDLMDNCPQGSARDIAARFLGISGKTIDRAEKIFGDDNTASPELRQAVREGTASVSAAAKVAQLPEQEQTRALTGGKRGIARAAKRITQESHCGLLSPSLLTVKEKGPEFDLAIAEIDLKLELMTKASSWPDDAYPRFVDVLRGVADLLEEQSKP